MAASVQDKRKEIRESESMCEEILRTLRLTRPHAGVGELAEVRRNIVEDACAKERKSESVLESFNLKLKSKPPIKYLLLLLGD